MSRQGRRDGSLARKPARAQVAAPRRDATTGHDSKWRAAYLCEFYGARTNRPGPGRAACSNRLHFSDLILKAPRSFYESTSIGGGINFAAAQLSRAPFEAERRAIDVSGDGTNNAGRDVQLDRNQAIAKHITINGLVILTDIKDSRNPRHTNPPEGLEKYYRDNVIGGPGSFVMVAEDFSSFGHAIIKKLVAEVATGPAQRRITSAN
jgi:hypothetical protein